MNHWTLWIAFTVILVCSPEAFAKKAKIENKESEISFQKKTLHIGGTSISAEIADTPEKSGRGLMFRKKLSEGEGMLFIFPSEEPRSFWMKNTFIPLSIGFFDAQKKLVEVFDMEPVKSEMDENPPSYPTRKSAKYALEVPKGWFQKHKIQLGTHFELK